MQLLRYTLFILSFIAVVIYPQLLNRAHAVEPPAIQLASKFRENIDVSQYWVSEKLDGVRAYWDGQQLISRRGNVFNAPDWFSKDFPQTPMDGELWIARGEFDRVSAIVRQHQPNPQDWQQIKLMIFDLPSATGRFSQRIEQMQTLVNQANSPYLAMIEQFKLTTHQQLMAVLNTVVSDGGEGLMLHHHNAIYQTKRSQDLMKLKKHDDAEAIVIKQLKGKGQFEHVMGALLVKTKEGLIFKLGSGFSMAERQDPPPIGSVVTYKYYGTTKNNIPRFASFLRVRAETTDQLTRNDTINPEVGSSKAAQ